MKIRTSDILSKAYRKFGVGAFNVFTTEQVRGVFEGAQKSKSPLIIQISPMARNFAIPEILESVINAFEKLYPEVIFSVHLDHGNIPHCENAASSGFYSSVMIDASHEEWIKNIEITATVTKLAHPLNISVEAELGVLAGAEDHLNIDKKNSRYTDPEQAAEFVKKNRL